MQKIGSISVICGPMFSSKSTTLLGKIRRSLVVKKKCVLITSKKDDRYENSGKLCTHDKETVLNDPNLKTLSVDEDISKLTFDGVDTVFIDEGQFIKGIKEFVVNNHRLGVNIVIAALDMDYKTTPFANISFLLSIAHHVKKLSACCYYCTKNACYSELIEKTDPEEEVDPKSGIIHVGGLDEYRACCKDCFEFDKVHTLNK